MCARTSKGNSPELDKLLGPGQELQTPCCADANTSAGSIELRRSVQLGTVGCVATSFQIRKGSDGSSLSWKMIGELRGLVVDLGKYIT